MTDLFAEYHAVREHLGWMDRINTGKLAIVGSDSASWLQGMISNDMRRLATKGQTRLQACVLNATGHLLTDLALVRIEVHEPIAAALGIREPFFLIDLPRENVAKIQALFERYIITEEVDVRDVSTALGCFSLQGPEAASWWSATPPQEQSVLTSQELQEYSGMVVPANHTGSGGADILFPAEFQEAIRSLLYTRGVREIGFATQELLRIEAGIPRYGMDMDEGTIPLEANLGPTHISLTKGCYVGQEIIARIDSRGHTNRALTGLELESGALPEQGDTLHSYATEHAEARETGRITSVVASSPAREGRSIALGYVRHEQRVPGIRLRVEGKGRTAEVSVVELPFFRKGLP